MDSIIKNVGKDYIYNFGKNLFDTFIKAFEMVDSKTKQSFARVFSIWLSEGPIFALETLQRIYSRMKSIATKQQVSIPALDAINMVRGKCSFIQLTLQVSTHSRKARGMYFLTVFRSAI